ncbi:MAG: hypothetical protein AAGC58_11520 [Asticcacaulis sp.]
MVTTTLQALNAKTLSSFCVILRHKNKPISPLKGLPHKASSYVACCVIFDTKSARARGGDERGSWGLKTQATHAKAHTAHNWWSFSLQVAADRMALALLTYSCEILTEYLVIAVIDIHLTVRGVLTFVIKGQPHRTFAPQVKTCSSSCALCSTWSPRKVPQVLGKLKVRRKSHNLEAYINIGARITKASQPPAKSAAQGAKRYLNASVM